MTKNDFNRSDFDVKGVMLDIQSDLQINPKSVRFQLCFRLKPKT